MAATCGSSRAFDIESDHSDLLLFLEDLQSLRVTESNGIAFLRFTSEKFFIRERQFHSQIDHRGRPSGHEPMGLRRAGVSEHLV